jgi:hypothetical protein
VRDQTIGFDLQPVDKLWEATCAMVERELEVDASVANAANVAATLIHVAAIVVLRTPAIIGLRSDENFLSLAKHVFTSAAAQTRAEHARTLCAVSRRRDGDSRRTRKEVAMDIRPLK